jgi:Zn-dependent peptidase ImmA (M78 family)
MEVASSFLGQAPVRLEDMADALGLTVGINAFLAPDISGQIVRDRRSGENRYHIDLNAHDSAARRRFTLAHEISHFLLHREFLDGSLTDDRMYRSRLGDVMERQANRLAAQLLMPANLVRVAWNAGAHDIGELAKAFDVSERAVEIRLRELELTHEHA